MPDQRVMVPPEIASPSEEVPEWVKYPETDGQPMPDGYYQRQTMFRILHALEAHFPGRDVYFGGDMFIYYREGRHPKRVAPDIFAMVGVPFEKDRVYLPSQHGAGCRISCWRCCRRRRGSTTRRRRRASTGSWEWRSTFSPIQKRVRKAERCGPTGWSEETASLCCRRAR